VTFRKKIENPDQAIAANVIIGLIRVGQHPARPADPNLEEAFVKEGGLRERMTRARLEERKRNKL
jgi:four helix bundle suffix protein